MSNESDKAAFDAHMSEIERLRANPMSASLIAFIEQAAIGIGHAAMATGAILGPVALEAAKSFAVATVTAELEKLGGKR